MRAAVAVRGSGVRDFAISFRMARNTAWRILGPAALVVSVRRTWPGASSAGPWLQTV